MSVEAMTWVFNHSEYTLGARLVHLAIADVANSDYEYRVWLKQESLAEKARLSVSQVQRILKIMVQDGALAVLERGGGRGKPTVYQLVMKPPQIADLSEKPPHERRETPASAQFAPLTNPNKPKGEKLGIFSIPVPADLPARVAKIREDLAGAHKERVETT